MCTSVGVGTLAGAALTGDLEPTDRHRSQTFTSPTLSFPSPLEFSFRDRKSRQLFLKHRLQPSSHAVTDGAEHSSAVRRSHGSSIPRWNPGGPTAHRQGRGCASGGLSLEPMGKSIPLPGLGAELGEGVTMRPPLVEVWGLVVGRGVQWMEMLERRRSVPSWS